MTPQSRTGILLLAIGVALNLLDAYFSGNLPFSPSESDQNNKVSLINRLGKSAGEPAFRLGTIFALIGAAILTLLWLSKVKR